MIMQRAWCHSKPVCLVGIFLIATTCVHCVPNQREKWKRGGLVWKEKIKCVGETILGFDRGFSQHPSVSLG